MHFNIKGQEPHFALRALSTQIHTVWQNKSAVWTHRSNPRWNDSVFNFIRVDVRCQNLKFKHLGIYIQIRLCLYQTLLCIFICFSNCQHKKMHRYTACICLAFIHCTFSNELLDCLQVRIQSHIAWIGLIFLRCVLSNISSKYVHKRMHSHTGCICLTFLHYAFSNVPSNRLPEKRHSYTGCICLTFLHCAFSYVS